MSSFLYILKHRNQPSFKIGKANNIWTRLKCIGGAASFDIENSHCIQFDSVDAAYRAERLLHRLFDGFLYGIDELKRYDGDTEHFKIECWDRVIACCKDNTDLIGGALAEVPAAPDKVPNQKTKPQKSVKLKRGPKHQAVLDALCEQKWLGKFNHYLKHFPCGIYEKCPGKYVLIGKGLGEMRRHLGDVFESWRDGFALSGWRPYGAGLFGRTLQTDQLIIASLNGPPAEYLNDLEAYLQSIEDGIDECLINEGDPLAKLEIERSMMAGSIVSSLPVLSIGEVKEFFWQAGFINSQNIDDDQVNDLLTVLFGCADDIGYEAYRSLCTVCNLILQPPTPVVSASGVYSDVRGLDSVPHTGNGSISRTLYA